MPTSSFYFQQSYLARQLNSLFEFTIKAASSRSFLLRLWGIYSSQLLPLFTFFPPTTTSSSNLHCVLFEALEVLFDVVSPSRDHSLLYTAYCLRAPHHISSAISPALRELRHHLLEPPHAFCDLVSPSQSSSPPAHHSLPRHHTSRSTPDSFKMYTFSQ